MDFIKANKKGLIAAAIAGVITAVALDHWDYNRTSKYLISASAAWIVYDNLKKKKKRVNNSERERHEVPGCEYLYVDIGTKDSEAGVQKYTKQLSQNPKDAESLLKRGVCYSNLNKNAEAIADFNAALEINPRDKSAISYRATSLGAMGDIEGAAKGFHSLLDLNENDYNALASLGNVYIALDQFEKALPVLNKAIEIDQAEGGIYMARAMCHYYLKDPTGAIADIDEAERIVGFENALSLFYRGLAEDSAGNSLKALEALTIAINKFHTAETNYLMNARAGINLNSGNYDEAINDSSASLKIEPRQTQALLIRGTAHRQKEECQKAIKDFDRVIELEPDKGNTLLKRGECYQQLNRAEDALADYSAYIEKEPEAVAGYCCRSKILGDLGRDREAINDLNKWIELSPESYEAYLLRSERWLSLGESETARLDKRIGLLKRGLANKLLGSISEAAKDIEDAYRLGEASAGPHVKELLQQSLIYENIYVKIHSAASRKDEPVEDLINRIKSMTAEEMLIDADIDSEENPEEESPYHNLSSFIRTFGLSGKWWENARSLDVYLRVKAARWSMVAVKMNLCTPESWAPTAFEILDDLFFRCGGRNNMYKIIGSAVIEDEEGLLSFLKVLDGEGSSFDDWQLNVPCAYRDIKKSVLLKLNKRVPTKKDTFDGIFAHDGQDVDHYVNIMNNRVLGLWAYTEWGAEGMNAPYVLVSGREVKNMSWYHPEGTFEDRKVESCFYYVYPDGIAVVREHNEYLDLKDDAQVQSVALTVIRDLMGDYDVDHVSDSFYEAVVNSKK